MTTQCDNRQLLKEWMTGLYYITDKQWESIVDRLYSGSYSDANDCWITKHNPRQSGYVTMGALSYTIDYVHRLSYRVHVHCLYSPLDIAHMCKNRSCFNPQHIRQVPHYINLQHIVPTYPTTIQDTLELVHYLDMLENA